jgi:hypothetical protein
MYCKIDPVLAEALGEIGRLSGLLKAHVEEVKRDRLSTQEHRAEDRLERQAMRADLRALAGTVDKVPAIDRRLADAEETIEEFKTIRMRVTVAAAVLSGGLYLAWQATAAAWPMIKGALLK